MRHTVLLLALLAGLSASCVRHVRSAPRTAEYGTCEGACGHYAGCRGDRDPAMLRSCMDECEAIFVTDGIVDQEALGDFEELECSDAVAFVEGDSGRPPGSGDAGGAPTGAAAATAGRER